MCDNDDGCLDGSLSHLESHLVQLAKLAIGADKDQKTEAAKFYYEESIKVAFQLAEKGSTIPGLKDRIAQYLQRAEELDKLFKKQLNEKKVEEHDPDVSSVKRAEFLLHEALDNDDENDVEEAIDLYLQAVELCLKAKAETHNQNTKRQLALLAEQALTRAEQLKGRVRPTPSAPPSEPSIDEQMQNLAVASTKSVSLDANAGQVLSSHGQKSGLKNVGPSSYSREEIQVLRTTSVINEREYVPFLTVDIREKFAFPVPFSDKCGLLKLSKKQHGRIARWSRLEDLCQEPKIFADIDNIDSFSIKQTVISDCSFITSLTVSALYEKRFKKKLISNIIYPQNRKGEAVYNPCGKYMTKLHINGVFRKVIIDDFFPVDNYGQLLCSHSIKRDEFWVSLLEKAYMKVMGGYDFPGSNSNIDLHALTGWIPDRMSTRDEKFNADKAFDMMVNSHRRGDVLITVATGELSDDVCERSGLVSTHAYAVLDLRTVEGKQLLLLKNPWSHVRWKGNYSERDTASWTPSLKKAMNYDPQNAKSFDDGVFYIDFKSLCKFYEAIYLNWNPSLFKYTYCTHSVWKSGTGPAKDLYNIGENPQYKLSTGPEGAPVWALLTRHITDRDDFAQNKEYIALIVYKSPDKVYMPFNPPPMIDGARVNSPHYLCKIPASQGATDYTLVISQYEKSSTIFYTLRAYSTHPFTMTKLDDPFHYVEKVTNDQWTESTAGGCANNHSSYKSNPVYLLDVQGPHDESNQILIDLKGPKEYSIGFDVRSVNIKNPSSPHCFSSVTSGAFRSGFTILKLSKVPAGSYHITPATFYPGQKGPFFLTVKSSCPFKLTKIK
ncbi:Calpain-7 [Halotydeus destructor]|nr:Calpain-7 [Halotydeus destructor]